MYHSPLNSFSVRLMLTALLSGVMLITGLFGFGGQPPSWAAPAQNPHLQTIPTRPPDDDDPPPPPDSAPPAVAPAPSPDEDKDRDKPDQPPEQTDRVNPDIPQSPQLPPRTDNGGQDEVKPAPIPIPKSDQNKDQAPPAQPAQGEGKKDSVVAFSPQADLSLSQTVDNPTPYLGEVITFTIALSNNGPNSATNVVMSDLLPPGLILSSTMPSRGWYNSNLGLWAVGIITPSQSVTLSLVVTVANAGTWTNTTEITAAHPADPDSIPGNSLEPEDDWTSLAIVALPATSQSFQSDSDSLQLVSATQSASMSPMQWIGSLSWLYALGLGVILILSGIYLVNRA